jgi:hypothetical protein
MPPCHAVTIFFPRCAVSRAAAGTRRAISRRHARDDAALFRCQPPARYTDFRCFRDASALPAPARMFTRSRLMHWLSISFTTISGPFRHWPFSFSLIRFSSLIFSTFRFLIFAIERRCYYWLIFRRRRHAPLLPLLMLLFATPFFSPLRYAAAFAFDILRDIFVFFAIDIFIFFACRH